MRNTLTLEAAIFGLYSFNVLVLPLSHLNFWLLTATFAASAAEIWAGSSILRRLATRLQFLR